MTFAAEKPVQLAPRLHLFTVDEYFKMAEKGILHEDEPIELLEGFIVLKGDTLPPYGIPVGIPPVEICPQRSRWSSYPLRRFTVVEYARLVDAEILDPNLRHELIEGWVVEKMTHKPAHDCVLTCIQDALLAVLPKEFCLRIQLAVALDESTLEPDIAVVRQPRSQYRHRHPSPHEVELLIEVADASLALDLGPKRRSYARNALHSLWVADVPHSQLHVFSEPSGPVDEPTYAQHLILKTKDKVPLRLRNKTIAHLKVADFFEDK